MKEDDNGPERPLARETPDFVVDSDFTGGAIHELPRRDEHLDREHFDERVAALVRDWGCGDQNQPLIEELITTALKIGREETNEGDLKLLNRSLKEMRWANNSFRPHQHRRKVTVFGSARTRPGLPEYEVAQKFAHEMVEKDFMVITGAGEGIMGAAQRGAGRENSFGLSIRLPFEVSANEIIAEDLKHINFNYFFTRKLTFVKESHAAVLFPGGFGTMDELFEVLCLQQTGKATIFPVVMLDVPGGSYWRTWLQFVREHLLRLRLISEEDFRLFKITDSVEEAVEEVVGFYRVFNSYRYVREKMVIRLNRALMPQAVEDLNERFKDIIKTGKMTLGNALPEEESENILFTLPRLIFTPIRARFGRFRELIDAINEAEVVR